MNEPYQHYIVIDNVDYQTELTDKTNCCEDCVFKDSENCAKTSFICSKYNSTDGKYRIWKKFLNADALKKRITDLEKALQRKEEQLKALIDFIDEIQPSKKPIYYVNQILKQTADVLTTCENIYLK